MRASWIGALLGTALVASAGAQAEPVRIGMITTLSGGGSSLGIDVRDGFLLALKEGGGKLGGQEVELTVEDDAMQPDTAKQIADKFIKRDHDEILTGIIWSNLALAVVPSAVADGVFYISPNAGPSQLAGKGCNRNYFNVAWQNDNLHEAMGQYMANNGLREGLHPGAQLSGRQGRAGRLQALLHAASWRARPTPSSARPTMPPRSRRSARPSRTRSSSSCPAAWASRS